MSLSDLASLGGMMITRIFVDDRGESHFSDIEMPLTSNAPAKGLPPMQMSPPIASTQVQFLVGPPALIAHDWHPAPARQFVLFLEGSLEVEVSNGQRRRLGQGAILFVEDTTGKGHKDHAVNDDQLVLVLIPVADEVNVEYLDVNATGAAAAT
jgi:hypothetical protein